MIVDTNFLMSAGQFKIDLKNELLRVLEEPFQLCAPRKVVFELEYIACGVSKDAANASYALKILDSLGVEFIDSIAPVDDWIAGNAVLGDVVATNDRELRHRLKKGVRSLVLKGKSKLGFA